MRRTMPKDDVAVIRGEVAVHLAAARSLVDSAPSGVHSITALINPRQCSVVTTPLASRLGPRPLAETEARIRLFFFTRTTAS